MDVFAPSPNAAPSGKLRFNLSWLFPQPASPQSGVPLKPTCKCVALIATAALLQIHTWAIVAKPHAADGFIDICVGLAVILCGWVFFLYGRAAARAASLRWHLFALSLGIGGLNYFRSALENFNGPHLPIVDHVLHGLAGTLTILALTLPSVSRNTIERALDIFVALCLCGLRIAFLFSPVVASEPTSRAFARFAFESALVLIIVLVALAAAPKAELLFFKSVLVLRIATFFGGICANQIGILVFHQDIASPWSIASTALRLGAALYLLKGLNTPVPIHVSTTQKAVISSLVPLTMSCLLVWLSVLLLPMHPYVGPLGIIVGVGGFMVRTALSALARHARDSARMLDAGPTSVPALDPLNSIETRAGLQRALANLAPAVSRQNPLSLILFSIENTAEPLDTPSPAKDEDHLIAIGRSLSQWSVADSSLCYMGNARFALVLPATSFTVANSLAEHIRVSLEILRLPAQDGPIAVFFGVAEASHPSQVSELLGIATNSLIRALIREDGRRRPTPLAGSVARDC